MNPARWRRLAAVGLIGLFVLPPPAASADTEDVTELAQRYAPLVVVREHQQECGPGEPFQPTEVDDVLGNPEVYLDAADGGRKAAPTSGDLASAGPDDYLDYPGDPLNPGCDYDRWAARTSADTPPTLYFHLASDPAHPDRLALQYWFFWLFNDWNNRHEGDWEMVQIVFDAATPAQALRTTPTSVAFAQHEGSETAAWDDPKLLKDGTRPVVYPSEGSHAAYFDQAQWFGKSAAAGFGCDDTSVTPHVGAIVLQPRIIEVGDEVGWLQYEGHWGQQAPSFNNGPTGPNTKRQWTEPITWQEEEGRDGAVAIPQLPGPAVAAFCAVTERGSILFIELLDRPWLTGLALLGTAAAIAALVRATRWRGADITHYDRERTSGQILSAAMRIYARRVVLFAVLGALFLACTRLVSAVRAAILSAGDPTAFTDTNSTTALVPSAVEQLIAILVQGPIVVVFVAACMAVVSEPHGELGLVGALRRAVSPPVPGYVIAGSFFVVAAMAVSVVLLPLGLWLVARWASAGAAAMVEGLGFSAALRRSAELTDQRRLRTLALTVLMFVVCLATGPALGAMMLLVTNWQFAVINAFVAVSYAVLLPILAVGLTLQFYDLRQEQARDAAAVVAAP